MKLKINFVEEELSKQLEETIKKGFMEHAEDEIGTGGDIKTFNILAKQDDEVIGVIIIRTSFGALHIKNLFIDKKYRRLGIGKKLMVKALEKGKQLGCAFAYVETMSFQAPLFYKKLGFKEDFVRHGYDKSSSFHYLQKKL